MLANGNYFNVRHRCSVVLHHLSSGKDSGEKNLKIRNLDPFSYTHLPVSLSVSLCIFSPLVNRLLSKRL